MIWKLYHFTKIIETFALVKLYINNLSNAFREDEVVKSLPVEEILKNAPDKEKDHFLVKSKV